VIEKENSEQEFLSMNYLSYLRNRSF